MKMSGPTSQLNSPLPKPINNPDWRKHKPFKENADPITSHIELNVFFSAFRSVGCLTEHSWTDSRGELQHNVYMPFSSPTDEPPGGFAVLPTIERTGALSSISERVLFVKHQGKSILMIDVSNCSAADVERIFRTVPDFVTTHPLGSVLALSDFTGASFDAEAIRVIKETAVFDKPFIKKSACTGIERIPEKFYEDVKGFSRRDFPPFRTRAEALTWLVKD